MKLELLVSAVEKDPRSLAEAMKIASDAVIVNQCDHHGYTAWKENGREIRCFSMEERGVGLSRNTALLFAEEDIVLFSDEDIRFDEGYEKKVLEAFLKNPDADVITFNFRVDESRATYHNAGERRIRWYNYGRYPTYSVAARLSALRKSNVSFSLLFGGGARYSNGEDSLFLHDCLKKRLHLYTSVEELGEEEYRESTWFKGYNEKFFVDRGVLYPFLYGKLARVFALRFLLSHRQEMCRQIPLPEAYRLMKKGISEGKQRR